MEKSPIDADPEAGLGSDSSPAPPYDSREKNGFGDSRAATTLHRLLCVGRVEEEGIRPLPLAQRTSRKYYNIFTVWFSMNTSILGVVFGLLGPTAYGLSLRDSSLVVIFFTLLSTIAPAWFSTLGPKTGMRQMIQARYSFGRYLVSIPVLLNIATLTGFVVIICVVGGQCLSAVSGGPLTPDAGIIIIALLGLLISFCGFKVLHYYEMYASVPSVIAIVIATGCGGSDLKKQAVPAEPASAFSVLSFGMIVASYMIPWSAIASDLTTYFDPNVSSWRVFAYSYVGLGLPTMLLMILGSAMGGALPNVPAWQDPYDQFMVGGLFRAMLSSAGGFGKFVLVVLCLTLLGNTAGTMYAITLNFQNLLPWFTRVPRYVFAIVITAIVIPVSIRAAHDFFDNLENFIALIGYWAAAFVGIFVVEHALFRRGRCDSYDPAIHNDARRLPVGAAALASGVLCFGLVVPCMAQIWYTGPIAETTGDIGFEVAFALSAVLYIPLRYVEKRFTGR